MPGAVRGRGTIVPEFAAPGLRSIRATVTAGAKKRSGFHVAQDGGDAKGSPLTIPHGGVRFRDSLHPVLASATAVGARLVHDGT